MVGKLIMTKGLPGSGKSTWAKEQMAKDPGKVTRVTKDDIRAELKKPWSNDLEKEVLRIRDFKVGQGLSAGKTVISDDTNFAPKHEARLRELAKKYKAEFVVNDSFLGVSVEECIRRDSLREEYERVGEGVIRDMAAKFLVAKPVTIPYVDDPTLPNCVIVDLDGTLALSTGLRGPYDHAKCADDHLNHPINRLISLYKAAGYVIVYMSGREDCFRSQSLQFLKKHGCPEGDLFMRVTGDHRGDVIVKGELFQAHVNGKFRVEVVIDDRPRVLRGWMALGLTTLAVGDLHEF